jgi:hypothetical protein
VVEQPIRNRQVASSTLALGSNIPFISSALHIFFAERVHHAHLGFQHDLDVNIHRDADVGAFENPLNRLSSTPAACRVVARSLRNACQPCHCGSVLSR